MLVAPGRRYGLPLLSPVDDDGLFTAEAGAALAGKSVLGDGNAACVDALRAGGCLILEEAYKHKYPYDWRTKKPTIFRATEQWFASVEAFRDAALAAVAGVAWVPAVGEKRITPMVAGRSDWCISRQRTWGVPIPVFYDTATGAPLLDAATLAHVQRVFAAQGSDAWWLLDVAELLPEEHRHRAATLRKARRAATPLCSPAAASPRPPLPPCAVPPAAARPLLPPPRGGPSCLCRLSAVWAPREKKRGVA